MWGHVDSPLIVVGLAATWLLVLALAGSYRRRNMATGAQEYQLLIVGTGITAAAVGILCYLTHYPLSRGLFLTIFGLGFVLLPVARYVVRRALQVGRRTGELKTRVLLAGSALRIDEINHVMQRETWLGYDVIGGLTPELDCDETAAGVPIIGVTAQVLAAVEATDAHAVLFTDGSFASSADFRRMAWDLETKKVQMIVVPGVTDVSAQRVRTRPVAGIPMVFIDRPQSQAAGMVFKRVFDILVGSFVLAFAALPMACIALRVKLGDGGQVLFRQTRVGRNGHHFTCYKFRTMVPNAEALLASLKSDDPDNVLFKMTDDPRITKVGKTLRRFSLDELPQLFNVLRGNMSLIGPRPPLPAEVAKYGADVHRRLAVRPGMTGLWQVSGRSKLPWDETVRLDIYYVDNWSLSQDIIILLRTLRAVVGSDGAY